MNIERQGTAIVEPDGDGGFFVMFPDGNVVAKNTEKSAQAAAARWLRQDAKKRLAGKTRTAAIGAIETRE